MCDRQHICIRPKQGHTTKEISWVRSFAGWEEMFTSAYSYYVFKIPFKNGLKVHTCKDCNFLFFPDNGMLWTGAEKCVQMGQW